MVLCISFVPEPFKTLNRRCGRQPTTLRLQSPKFNGCRRVIIKHSLCISKSPCVPLPVKNTLNNRFLPYTPNERNILSWPYSLIDNLIPHNQLPFNLLIHHIPYHGSLVSFQLTRNPLREPTLPHRHPISHRGHEAY